MKEETQTQSPSGELEELRREVAYLRRLSEQTIAKMLQLDMESISIRHELEQKRRGFSLMAELTGGYGRRVDYNRLFISVSRRINATLGMQRTVVLMPGPDGFFQPAVLQGYSAEEQKILTARKIFLPPEFLNVRSPVLITGADPAERLADVRESLALPYLIASPVVSQDEVEAVLITGRLLEQQPYLPRLGYSDVETVQTVASHLATLLSRRLLAEAEQRTQVMLNAMPFCCNFWDEDYNNVDCNEAAARLFDLSSKAEYLEKFHELSPERQPNGRLSSEYAMEKVDEAFSTGHVRFEWLHRKLSGELMPVEVILERVTWGKGHIVVGYTLDLREQKAMLAAMEKNQDELRVARDAAEESAKAKGEFLANMSHEFRTPMNAILGMTYLLGKTDITEKQRGYLGQVEHSTTLLLRVINDILDFTKLDSGKMQLEVAEFSLRNLMRHIHDIVRSDTEAGSLKLHSNIDNSAEDLLMGDSMRLEQVLLNLTSNAIKFTPAGGELCLRVRRLTAPAGHTRLRFEVEDSGIGMSEEQVRRLFTPFSQADSSATRLYGGMGLGLTVSYRLVNMMGGELVCESREGEGSIFSFSLTLPLADGVVSLPEAPHEEENTLQGLRVLLAEDNEINQMIAEELLHAQGVDVRVVGTGQEALNALEKELFDLILMDIQMPVMDGLTAALQIRSRPEYANLPIIAMTAHAMTGDREISLDSGMNDHITKPIDPDLLYATLKRWSKNIRGNERK